ncbi:hypothetical protein LCGC14_1118190 [marine sediment metagenome]|uniref:Methyltransferase small domain-containing protein n=1 Tax=marine sediment metagenome TaxID=412755 RepID=A0A0F9PMX6_9ZZZZ
MRKITVGKIEDIKMAAPLTTSRNKYFDNRKENDIKTPYSVCRFLYELLSPAISRKKTLVIDVGCGDGRLSELFMKRWTVLGIEQRAIKKSKLSNIWSRCDFLAIKDIEQSHAANWTKDSVALVISNPPFNNKSAGRKLIPEVFTKKIFDLLGDNVPLCMFVPMGFRLNQRLGSSRWRYFRDECKAEITSIISLPLNLFKNVEFHSEILIWNIQKLKAHYWIPEKYLQGKMPSEDISLMRGKSTCRKYT